MPDGFLREGFFFLAGVPLGGQLPLDGVHPLDQLLGFRLRPPGLIGFSDLDNLLQLRAVGPGKIQAQLRQPRTGQLIKDAGGKNNGLQGAAGFPAQRPGAQSGQADGDPGLRHQGEAQIIPDLPALFHQGAAGPGAGVFSENPGQEIYDAHHEQRRGADGSAAGKDG